MKRESVQQLVVFGLLATLGIGVRLFFRDLPNFAPVAALALFAGFYFQSAALALALPLTVMLVSDQFLGGYDWVVMTAVYGMLAAPLALRPFLRRRFSEPGSHAARNALTLAGCSLAGSIAFFVVTNFAAWTSMDIYATTWQGLGHCYLHALPFFRYTLAGDAVFATVLFGSYALLQLPLTTRAVQPITE